MRSYRRNRATSGSAGLVLAAALLAPLAASAQDAPLSHLANPGIYKVLAENDQFRVVLATWKPGQRDASHSHPANATYAVTACDVRTYGPDNKVAFDGRRAQGSVILQAPIPSHTFENHGSSDCQILIVERK